MESYTPINCEVHDGFELACIRNTIHEIVWRDDAGQIHQEKLRFLTIDNSGHEENLIAENQSGEKYRIRLDRIESQLSY
ncbi:MAG: Rho-binding antiterminator [Amphritea sp.]